MSNFNESVLSSAQKRILETHKRAFEESEGKRGPLAALKKELEALHGPLSTHDFLSVLTHHNPETLDPKPAAKGAKR